MREILAAALLAMPMAAQAADISLTTTGDGTGVISISGPITAGDDATFERLATPIERADVLLSGPGGFAETAVHIGDLIRKKGFTTEVPGNATCASACGFIWLAGVGRFVGYGAKVGFHGVYNVMQGGFAESGPGNAVVGAYLGRLGLSDDVIARVTTAAPTDMTWLEDGIGVRYITAKPPKVAEQKPQPPVKPHPPKQKPDQLTKLLDQPDDTPIRKAEPHLPKQTPDDQPPMENLFPIHQRITSIPTPALAPPTETANSPFPKPMLVRTFKVRPSPAESASPAR